MSISDDNLNQPKPIDIEIKENIKNMLLNVDRFIDNNLFKFKGMNKSGHLDLNSAIIDKISKEDKSENKEVIRFGKNDIGAIVASHLNRITQGQSLSSIKLDEEGTDPKKKTNVEKYQESKGNSNKER